jgi:hypothetical protein
MEVAKMTDVLVYMGLISPSLVLVVALVADWRKGKRAARAALR